jgi:hypothetical protein
MKYAPYRFNDALCPKRHEQRPGNAGISPEIATGASVAISG